MDPATVPSSPAERASGATGCRREPDCPGRGDVVVDVNGPGASLFTLRQVPGYPQVGLASRESAVAYACRFAADHAVDGWISSGQRTTRLLSCRSGQ